ncbi:thiamine pyrophosphate enzyme, N-terminal TPP binding domain-containing protein [Lipomyces oligophaga]|uniref:thiamine pyrophosphate enzyme, N-terminal TPP binding domain-containing protein n=1 Tax=Lipomyces oligophaga TaxID=45792 RepID=UPI0034CD4F0B
MATPNSITGADLIAASLYDLGVRVMFGIVGIPVIEVADACIARGIKFISFRNEQAASYAATAYGYLTGKPGVCLVVGGPGVLHAIAGIGNATHNCFPLLLLAGSSESHQVYKGAFQEIDQVATLTPMTKFSSRPPSLALLPSTLERAYRTAYFGRPGATYVDLPADFIQGAVDTQEPMKLLPAFEAPKPMADPARIRAAAAILKSATAPLVIIGKGAAYARAEKEIRNLIETTGLPFLPTPMGKGVVSDYSPLNFAAARSAALKSADVILLLGGRLNWILHYGEPPKYRDGVKVIQIDIEPEELGMNAQSSIEYGIVGDISLAVDQLTKELGGFKFTSIPSLLTTTKARNIANAAKKASNNVIPMTYEHTYKIINEAIKDTKVRPVFVSEGANTMDIARSAFDVDEPRARLDAGTMATMGVGIGYGIASAAAFPNHITICIEGDSAFGFSGLELETAVRAGYPLVVFVMNNSGVYRGVTEEAYANSAETPLPSTALGLDVRYDLVAQACGAIGMVARTPDELYNCAVTALTCGKVALVNIIIDKGVTKKLAFGWLASTKKSQPKL